MSDPRRDYDWNLLKTFHAVAREGGVSAAARALSREQPTVSAALKRLEGHLGVALCERSNRGIVLTPAGSAVLAACEDVRVTLDRLSHCVTTLRGAIQGTLRMRMISDVVAPSLDRALAAFHDTHPRVEIRIDIAPWRQVVDSVLRDEADLGVACDSARSDALSYRPLVDETQQLYCGPSHPLYGAPPVDPKRLEDETFVLTGEDEPDELARFRAAHKLGRHASAAADTLHEVRKLIQMGFGIGFLPTAVGDEPGPGGPLWPLLAPETLPTYPLFLVTRRSTKHPPHLGRLLDAFLAGCPAETP